MKNKKKKVSITYLSFITINTFHYVIAVEKWIIPNQTIYIGSNIIRKDFLFEQLRVTKVNIRKFIISEKFYW